LIKNEVFDMDCQGIAHHEYPSAGRLWGCSLGLWPGYIIACHFSSETRNQRLNFTFVL